MEKTFQLEIMTPEKQFFKGQAEGLIMPGAGRRVWSAAGP